VWAGQSYVSPELSTHLIERSHRQKAAAKKTPGLDALTSTERTILRLIAEFKTTRQIADVLCISPRTVDHHRANIAQKLELRGSHALTRFAVEHHAPPKMAE
jgi:two-component system, NarL family, response regulator DegU